VLQVRKALGESVAFSLSQKTSLNVTFNGRSFLTVYEAVNKIRAHGVSKRRPCLSTDLMYARLPQCCLSFSLHIIYANNCFFSFFDTQFTKSFHFFGDTKAAEGRASAASVYISSF
jgi:hypothetical protein